MAYDSDQHHRQSIRLPEFDYSRSGAYFITLCVHHRREFFGAIVDGQMQCTPAGDMIQAAWDDLPRTCPGVGIDAFVVMPNHVHGIIWLQNVRSHLPEEVTTRFAGQRPKGTEDGTLGRVVQRFKSLTTNHYIRGVKTDHWPPFDRHVWQPNYFEHVVRNDEALSAIREYIVTNPQRWTADKENPHGTGEDDVETWVVRRGEPRVHPDVDGRRGEPRVRPRSEFSPAAPKVDPGPMENTGEHKVRPYSSATNVSSGGKEEGEHKVRPYGSATNVSSGGKEEGEHKVRPYGVEKIPPLRIGHGYDLHRLQPGGKLMLAGIEVSTDLSPIAHSDGDVVIHALVDALLGALGGGDIGELFPNTDPQWKDVPSKIFLEHVYTKVRAEGYSLVNADVTILAERPKLKSFKPAMRQFLEGILGGTVNVKAGTNEGCDAIGRGEAIAAHAVVLLARSG